MFKQLLNGVRNQYKKMQEEAARYQDLLGKVFTLPKFYHFSPIDKKQLTVSYKLLMDMCADLNERDALIIRGLIPMDEVVIFCFYAIECKTNLKFYFVATTKYLWLINADGYLKYNYQDLVIDIVKNGMLSKVLLLGNMLFNVNGINEDLLQFVRLIQDISYRLELINQKLQMFCNTIPLVFYLNDIGSGISIGTKNELVFHAGDVHNKYNICEIKNYELLLDDIVVREKRSNRRIRLTANKNSCYEMMLRITTSDQEFLIPILKKTAFMTLYSSTSVEFMKSKDFADKLINLLDDMDEKMLNGGLQ